MAEMTVAEALRIRDMARAIRERMAADGVIESPVKDEAIDVLAAEVRRLQAGHCKDCCCARAWKALNIDQCTGKSIPEHIEALKAEVERLSRGLEQDGPK